MKKYKLKDLLDVTRGATLPGVNYATEGELIRLTLGNFDYQNNGFKENLSKDDIFYNGEVADTFILKEGDIVTPLTEQAIGLLGSTAKIPKSGKYIQSQDVALIKVKPELLDHNFAYYMLPTPCIKKQLSAGAQQTSIRHTSPDKIKDCSFFLPELNEQKKIANLLDKIEDKLALNHRSNVVLEKMAKQLYDYWFVQFDFPDKDGKPYKSSGGKMEYNETLKREIPEGWEVKRVKDFFKIFTGKKDVSKIVPGVFKFFSCAPESLTSNEYIDDNEVILVSGNGSYTGRVSFYKGKFDLYQRTYGCTLFHNDYAIPYFYYTMKYLFQPIASGGKHGSSIPYIVLSDLADFCFVFDSHMINLFNSHISSVFYQSHFANDRIIEKLNNLRDFLLPLLMNGQVTINK